MRFAPGIEILPTTNPPGCATMSPQAVAIPQPILTGYLSGVDLIIMARKLPKFFGITTNVLNAIALGKIDELREELSAQGITINFAGLRHDLTSFFKAAWVKQRSETEARFNFPTIDAAVVAFRKNRQKPSAADLDAPS
jgi:MFS superfamily sulfate permease-like transporter